MISTFRAVLALLVQRASNKLARLIAVREKTENVHCDLAVWPCHVLTPEDTLERVPDEWLCPWREA